MGDNHYITTCDGPEFSINYSADNLCFVIRVYLPPNYEFALVYGENYEVRGSDFTVFD